MGFVMLWNRMSRRTREREREKEKKSDARTGWNRSAIVSRIFSLWTTIIAQPPIPWKHETSTSRDRFEFAIIIASPHNPVFLETPSLPFLLFILRSERGLPRVCGDDEQQKIQLNLLLSKEGPPFQISWSDHHFFQSNRLDWKIRTRKKLSV